MTLNRYKLALAVGAAALSLGISQTSQAALVNGGFETGDFTGWTTIGNASIQDATYGVTPAEGTFQALITTGDSSLSNGAGGTAVSAAALDTFLGLAANTLEATGAVNGSAFKQTFSATAGDVINFKFDYLTNDPGFDRSFFLLSPQIGTPTTLATTAALSGSPTPFSVQTGYLTGGPIVIGVTGTYTLAFGVVNNVDANFNSGLLVDFVTQNGSTGAVTGGGGGSSVPLPAAVFVAPLGAFVAGAARKRFRRQEQTA